MTNSRPAHSASYFAVAAILFTLGNSPATNAADLPVAALICEQRNEIPWVDVAEATLASDARIRLVDREHLAKVLAEQKLATLIGPADGATRIEVGRLVGCDLLILVRHSPPPQDVVRVVVADTRTGIRLVTAEFPAKHAAETRRIPPALLTAALQKRAVTRPIVLAIPPLANDDLSRSNQFLQDSLASVCETVAARYPQILLVELEEAREIAKENVLTTRETSRVLPHYLLGRFRLESSKADRPPLAELRLEHGNTLIAEKRSESPTPANIGAFVQSAAAELLSSLADRKGDADVDNAADAEKLAQQSLEFMKVGDYEQGVRLAEASLLLRPDQLDLRHTLRNVYKDLANMQYDDPRMDRPRFDRQFQKALFYAERNLQHFRIYLNGINKYYTGNSAPVTLWDFDRHYRSGAEVHAAIVKHDHDYRDMLVETIELKIKRGQKTGDMTSLLFSALGYYHKQDHGSQKQYLENRLRLLQIVEGTPQQRRYFYSTILTFGVASPDADALAFYKSFLEASDPELVAAATAAKEKAERRLGLRPPVVAPARPSGPRPEPPVDARSADFVRLTPVEFSYLREGRQTAIQFQGVLTGEGDQEVVWGFHGPRVVLHHLGREPFRKIFETDNRHDFGDGCYDGKYVWLPVSGAAAHVLRIDPVDGAIVQVGAEQGLPDIQVKFTGCICTPLEPGRMVLVAWFGQQNKQRSFIAEITCNEAAPPRVRIVHEAREHMIEVDPRAQTVSEKTNTNLSYWPKFVLPLRDQKSSPPTRLLIPRSVNGPGIESNSLVVDLATGKTAVTPAKTHGHISRNDVVIHDDAGYWVASNKVWRISAEDPTQRQEMALIKEDHGAFYFTKDGILIIGAECWFSEDWSTPFRRLPSGVGKFVQSYFNSSHFSSQFGPLLKATAPGAYGGEWKIYRVEIVRNGDSAK